MVGPSWRDRFGDAAFDSAHSAWSEARLAARCAQPVERLEDTPERRSLDALVRAWEAGLTKVVVLPCRGAFTRVLSARTLLVTEATRSDPHRYAAALATFADETR